MLMRFILMILSNGTSSSIFPIQKLSPPSLVTSTDRTELYQNHATIAILHTEMETTVACALIGTAATSKNINIVSNRKKRTLNATIHKI